MINLFDKLYKNDKEEFYKIVKKNLIKNKKMFIVTANPETFYISDKDEYLNNLLLDKETVVVPDGISVVKCAKLLKYNIKERITGIDISTKLLEYGNELNKSIYLFGAKQNIIDDMISFIKKTYPNLKIVGATNGYINDKDKVFDEIINKKPDIILVALGIPLQEKLIYKHLNKAKKGIFIGVGGSLDVLSGNKKRAPKIFIKLNLEWFYRILKEPKRLKRFYESNIKFMFEIKKEKTSKRKNNLK